MSRSRGARRRPRYIRKKNTSSTPLSSCQGTANSEQGIVDRGQLMEFRIQNSKFKIQINWQLKTINFQLSTFNFQLLTRIILSPPIFCNYLKSTLLTSCSTSLIPSFHLPRPLMRTTAATVTIPPSAKSTTHRMSRDISRNVSTGFVHLSDFLIF